MEEYQQKLKILPDDSAIHDLALRAYSDDTGVRKAEQVIQEVIHELIVKILQNRKSQPKAGQPRAEKREYTLTKVADTYKLV